MLGPLQKDKITHYFQVVLDQDRNGILEENDFLETGEELCILWRYKPLTPQYNEVIDRCRNNWKMFQDFFKGHGARADVDQFLDFFDQMLQEESGEMYNAFVRNIVGEVFDAFDVNGDGVISINEYVDMFMCYHIKIKYSAKAFVKLDRDGNDEITKEELMEAVDEFFKSNDEKSRGNWLFGFWGDRDI